MMCRVVKNHRMIVRLVYHEKTLNWCQVFPGYSGEDPQPKINLLQNYVVRHSIVDVRGCLLISLW